MTQAAIIRALESAATFFVVTFIVTAAGLLESVDLSDSKAVETALATAALGAIVAALKQVTGFTALGVVKKP